MSDILLVHGAWHGGWCWRHVADRLRAGGLRVLTPTLTGLGERAHLLSPETGLALHLADLLAVIRCEGLEKATIVGHSYGAMPAALACQSGAIARFVSLDGVALEPGRALADDVPQEQRRAAEAMLIDGLALPAPPPETFDVPSDHPAHGWALARTSPMPWKCLTDPFPAFPGRFGELPRAYVAAARNSMAGPARGLAQARTLGWQVETIDSGHDLPLTAPEATAEMIARLARA